MKMNKELYELACLSLAYNYKGEVDLGTTEYSIYYEDKTMMLLIPGTNEPADWKKNFNLTSTDGIKRVGVEAMFEIFDNLKTKMKLPRNLTIVVHSKSAPTGVALAKYSNDKGYNWKIIAFNPARSVRRSAKIKLDNMVIFRNHFDPVSELLGIVNFTHPKCKTYFNWGFRHSLKYWIKFIRKMREK